VKWKKLGLVYGPDGSMEWAKDSALTPTPITLNESVIRVYAGFRDRQGISRIGYVDVDATNPVRILKVSQNPVLDIGRDGSFDDNGLILGDFLRFGSKIMMYYVGFQHVQKAKFLAFTGLAQSLDNGESFERVSEAPVLDRKNEAIYIRALHSVIYEENKIKAWCGVGNSWEFIGGKPFPRYNIRYYESYDGINFTSDDVVCIDVNPPEYRIGRPRVYKRENGYFMYYTYGTVDGEYICGYAESADGINWTRKDKEKGIELSLSGWDSKHLCYPALIDVNERTYMFYNGNYFGKDGFGVAELIAK